MAKQNAEIQPHKIINVQLLVLDTGIDKSKFSYNLRGIVNSFTIKDETAILKSLKTRLNTFLLRFGKEVIFKNLIEVEEKEISFNGEELKK